MLFKAEKSRRKKENCGNPCENKHAPKKHHCTKCGANEANEKKNKNKIYTDQNRRQKFMLDIWKFVYHLLQTNEMKRTCFFTRVMYTMKLTPDRNSIICLMWNPEKGKKRNKLYESIIKVAVMLLDVRMETLCEKIGRCDVRWLYETNIQIIWHWMERKSGANVNNANSAIECLFYPPT